MDIGLLNERIDIQKNMVLIDAIGNHTNAWIDYFSCATTASGAIGDGQDGSEDEQAGQKVDTSRMNFTVRYCVKAAAVNAMEYRIIFHGEIYDIISVDYMNFKKKCMKFKCKKVRR